MDKRHALQVLISSAKVLTDDAKTELLTRLLSADNPLSDEEVDAVGRFLAQAQKRSVALAEEAITNIELLIAEMAKREQDAAASQV